MPNSDPYHRSGIIIVLALLIGIILLPASLLEVFIRRGLYIFAFPDIFLLTFGIVGIIVIRKRISVLKRTRPELFKGLEDEEDARPTKCAICGAEPAFRYRCYYCRRYFCEEHILPRNHHCSMAPTASYQNVLLTGTLMIFVGIAILYVSFLPTLGLARILGGLLIFLGTMFLIVRAWEERQFRRAIGPNYESIILRPYHAENNKTVGPPCHDVHLKDYPRWLLASLIVAVIVAFMSMFNLFGFNLLLEDSLVAFALITVIYFRLYDAKIRKKKRKQAQELSKNKQFLT